jgi:uncharacterized membrane protein YraQ (UPF0718 family)
MTDLTASPPAPALPAYRSPVARLVRSIDPVVLVIALAFAVLALTVPGQALDSAVFVGRALGQIAPWFALSVLIAAATKASSADALVAYAFAGRPVRMVALGALFGALSPFCSCGVIPLIAGLLTAGVPLAPVMAFWIASPLMDPNMFILTAATLGTEFALAKTAAAIGMGLLGGYATMAVTAGGGLSMPLRRDNPSACARKSAAKLLAPPRPVWRFWREAERAQSFTREAGRTTWFLGRWMTVAFLVESLMVAWVPADTIADWLGGNGAFAIPAAVALGVPAYLNGFAAIPLVGGLIDLGMSKAVGLAFMVAGGVTSIPAMIAVWAIVKPRVFALYLALAAIGSLASGYAYALWLAAAP